MNTNTTPAAVGSSAELGSLLDDWAEAAGHVWVTRSGEQYTAWAVLRSDLEQLVCAYAAAEVARAVAAEHSKGADLADEYNRLIRHMDAGGSFPEFQVAEARRRFGE